MVPGSFYLVCSLVHSSNERDCNARDLWLMTLLPLVPYLSNPDIETQVSKHSLPPRLDRPSPCLRTCQTFRGIRPVRISAPRI